MTITAPPRPPRRSAPDDLEALIKEARRRARRRRLWYVAAVLVAAAGAVGAFGSGHDGPVNRPTAEGGSPSGNRGHARVRIRIAPVARPGQLTMVGLPTHKGEAPPGWYELSTVVNGRLHPFLRCPYHEEYCGVVASVAWARDGTRIAFSITSVGGTTEFNGLHVVTLRTGQDFWMLVPGDGWGPQHLEWSPDGSRIAFDSLGSIYVLDLSSLRVTELAGRPIGASDSSPSWSSDGRRLVLATEWAGSSSISVINTNGSHRRLLASGASAPSWSPDGRTIAYRARCGIKLTTPSGKGMTPGSRTDPCHAIGVPGDPVWSPDGRKIAILHARPFTRGTVVMDADGSNLRLLTHATGSRLPHGRPDASWQPEPRI
jgi:dipeptidyl aminopeptidase/acylaminoacyl peptidase